MGKKVNVTKPVGDWMLASVIKGESVTKGGIKLPTKVVRDMPYVRIDVVGADVTDYKKGDLVIIKNWGGSRIEIEESVFVFFQPDDVVAIIVEEEVDDGE